MKEAKHSLRSLFSRKAVIQIAGIADAEEARLVAACGADLLGFPLGKVRDKSDADAEEAGRIIRGLRLPVRSVLITYSTDAGEIARTCRQIGAAGVQLHGAVEIPEFRRLRTLCPQLFVVKTLAVGKTALPGLIEEMKVFENDVDAFLTDTFDAATGRWGATGKTHDWAISRAIVERSARPVILAGGLTPENVARAIREVRPSGVDAHTGVEDAAGRKDPALLRDFVSRAREAFEQA